MSTDKVTVEGAVALDEAMHYIEDLAVALKTGHMRLERGLEGLTLCAPARVDLKITAKRRGRERKLAIKLSWADQPASDFRIGPCPSGPAA